MRSTFITSNYLPLARDEMQRRRWNELDVLLITGDAYVDHPSFGVAVIGRILENRGYRVGIIAQPDWRRTQDFLVMGRPGLFVGISSGNVDSMVANYTANRKRRVSDDYSPGDQPGLRPDRALIVYANRAREAFGAVPIVLGGIESSLRRLAHYDYWNDTVRRSVLVDAKADILVYGMGEAQVLDIAERLRAGQPADALDGIRGTVVARRRPPEGQAVLLPSFEEASSNHERFLEAFRVVYAQMNPHTAQALVQPHGDRQVIQFPPAFPLSEKELDRIHELPYTRRWHPRYDDLGGVRALETVRFSIISHRGCCGECSFCSLFLHQGRIVSSRNPESILREARELSRLVDFKGTITDIGGPTANLYSAFCPLWEKKGFCSERQCLMPEQCPSLRLGYRQSLELYRAVRCLPRVKHLFLASGFRHDLLLDSDSDEYLEEILQQHISGQLKLAPEHTEDRVLSLMNKPSFSVYERFLERLERFNRRLKRRIYLVNYFISAHPGSSLKEALDLALSLNRRGMRPEQVQDFFPLPMTVSGCMYYTGVHPFTGERLYAPRSLEERRMQRALLQPRLPANRPWVLRALKKAGAERLAARLLASGAPKRQKEPG